MGFTPRAHLAYGYDLGTSEDFKAAQRTKDGSPDLPWLDEDDDDLASAIGKKLLVDVAGFTETDWRADGYYERKRAAEARVGVEVRSSGHGEYSGWVLVARGTHKSVEWSDVMVLDLADMEHPPDGAFDRLTEAVEALGITPHQEHPKWLVYPSYG